MTSASHGETSADSFVIFVEDYSDDHGKGEDEETDGHHILDEGEGRDFLVVQIFVASFLLVVRHG